MRFTYLKLLTVCLILLAILVSTNPTKIPALYLIVPYILIFTIFHLISRAVLKRKNLNKRAEWLLASIFSVFITLLIVLQSIGQLVFRDVVTLILILIVAYFYITRSVAFSD